MNSKLLPWETGQDYIFISDTIVERLSEHDDVEVIKAGDRFRALLGDKLYELGSHVFGIYSSSDFQKQYGVKNEPCDYRHFCSEGFEELEEDLKDKIKDLETKIEKLTKCVEFYGDKENWDYDYPVNSISNPVYFHIKDSSGGALARQTLKELEKGEKSIW